MVAFAATTAAASYFVGDLRRRCRWPAAPCGSPCRPCSSWRWSRFYRRADWTDRALREAEAAQERLRTREDRADAAPVAGQLEPHFLFNTLANVRRLYRTDPDSGASAIASLMLYLKAAMPQLRRETATLGASSNWCARTSTCSGCAWAGG